MFSIQPGIRPARGRHHRGRQKQNIAAAPTCDKENQVRWHPSFKGSVSWWGFCWRFDLNIDNVSVIRWPEPEVRPVVELRYSRISSKWCKTVNVSFCVSKLRSEKLSAKTCQRIRPFQMLRNADCFPEKKWTSTSARHICSQVMNWNKRGHIYQSHICTVFTPAVPTGVPAADRIYWRESHLWQLSFLSEQPPPHPQKKHCSFVTQTEISKLYLTWCKRI